VRLFRREVEVTLKVLGAIALVTLIALPTTWSYEQRQKTRHWQTVACAYRLKEVERRAPMLAAGRPDRDPCRTLSRLGLDVDMPP
jgi:hypothetical protein